VFPEVTLGCSDGNGAIAMSGLSMTLYTCAACGFSQLYMKEPVSKWKQTPEKQAMELEWLRPPAGPYR